ncbi:MAG: hypothetical protein GMKNLPBB_00374 [Myxococcota bacterium]|nr:hypothetical protein [Myxococcota bacterium]
MSSPRVLVENVRQVISGKDDVIELAVIALLGGGHLLIEDVPGVGKSTLALALARSVDVPFRRIQFTSDLLPSDITGVMVFDQTANAFSFKPGPIFAGIVLGDEINRTTPKTQSALLEAMADGKVSLDNHTYALPRPFMVIATQNPYEFYGTYPLPESQMDRFLFRISMGYPDERAERNILAGENPQRRLEKLQPVMTAEQVVAAQTEVDKIHVAPPVLDYIIAIARQTRESSLLELGLSTRGTLALKKAAQSRAYLKGRNYCTPDDVKSMAVPALSHRVLASQQRNGGGGRRDLEAAIAELVESVPAPV